MKKLFLLALSLLVITGMVECLKFDEGELETEDKLSALDERWRRYHMVWRSMDEKRKRYNVSKANARYINDFSKKDRPDKLGLNKFADMTNDEFRRIYAGCYKAKENHRLMLRGNGTFMYEDIRGGVPSYIDWREEGAVNPVKNQLNCEAVFTGECGTTPDHAVVIVGYSMAEEGTKYWIVRNSWGDDWAENGYIRMEGGNSDERGLCGIAMEASYPIKNKSDNPGDENLSAPVKDKLCESY